MAHRGKRPRSGPERARRDEKRHSGRKQADIGRRTQAGEPRHEIAHLTDDIVRELKETARPGKGDILVKVFAEAVGAFMDDDFDEAVRLGEQAKHIALRSTAIREFLGLAYYRSERWNEAARELGAFRRISGSTEQNPVIADCYRAMGKPERALQLCDEIDPSVAEAIRYEGAIVGAGALADMGRIDEAIERLERLDLRPDVAGPHHLRAWYVLGDLLARRGRFTQAREWFEAVAAADPEMSDAPSRAEQLSGRNR